MHCGCNCCLLILQDTKGLEGFWLGEELSLEVLDSFSFFSIFLTFFRSLIAAKKIRKQNHQIKEQFETQVN